jgi:hypothetical protein
MVSSTHEDLVCRIKDCINTEYAAFRPRILIDRVGPLGEQKPRSLEGYIPDIYCTFSRSDLVIVGDAKTPRDLESVHSMRQYEWFFRHLALHKEGLLVVATLWPSTNLAKHLLKKIRDSAGAGHVDIRVLNDLT